MRLASRRRVVRTVLGRIAPTPFLAWLGQTGVMFLLIRVGRVAAQIRVITRQVYGVAVFLAIAPTPVALWPLVASCRGAAPSAAQPARRPGFV